MLAFMFRKNIEMDNHIDVLVIKFGYTFSAEQRVRLLNGH